MRLPLILASILFSLAVSPGAGAAAGPAKKPNSSRKLGISIHVGGGGWGSAKKEEIEAVLYAVADELLTHVPKKLNTPIVVTHTHRQPMALYDKGPGGEYQVHLHARNRAGTSRLRVRPQLCHIMSNYEENVGADTTRYNQWFEETLCETASLHTLKSVAETWEANAPNAELARQVPQLRALRRRMVSEGHRRLPPDVPLAAWLADHREELRTNPYLRKKIEVVANLLLPLFERDPTVGCPVLHEPGARGRAQQPGTLPAQLVRQAPADTGPSSRGARAAGG